MFYRPGLSNAGSRRSGLFVAPITNTSDFLLRPSNSASNWETTLKKLSQTYMNKNTKQIEMH